MRQDMFQIVAVARDGHKLVGSLILEDSDVRFRTAC